MFQAAALFFILFAIDWVPVADDTRLGQLRFLLLTAALISHQYTKKLIGLPAALLFSYAGFMWVMLNFQPHGLLHLTCVAAAIAAGKWLADWDAFPTWTVRFGFVQAVFGLAQWLGWDPFGFSQIWFQYKPTGLQGQETLLGALLAATLAPALFRKHWLSAATIFACILATKSTMSAAAAGTVIFLWLFSLAPALAIFLAVAVLATGAVWFWIEPYHPFFSLTRRGELWALGWYEHYDRPIFGWGPGSWQPKKIEWLGLGVSHLHNEYLEFLVEYGLVGTTLLLLALARFLRRFRFTWHHAMVAGLLVNAGGNFPLHLAATGTLFVAGWILSERRGRIERCEILFRLLSLRSYCMRRLGR